MCHSVSHSIPFPQTVDLRMFTAMSEASGICYTINAGSSLRPFSLCIGEILQLWTCRTGYPQLIDAVDVG